MLILLPRRGSIPGDDEYGSGHRSVQRRRYVLKGSFGSQRSSTISDFTHYRRHVEVRQFSGCQHARGADIRSEDSIA